MTRRLYIFILLLLSISNALAQTFKLKGKVLDENGAPIELASITCISQGKATMADLKGQYELTLSIADSVVIRYSMIGYQTKTRVLNKPRGTQTIQIRLSQNASIDEITVTQTRRQTTQTEQIDVKNAQMAPSATGNAVENLIQTQAGVSTHNEMSSQYNVRGGSFDENSVYINGIEVYRPLLVRSAEQEGLSAINPDMVEKIGFSTGGFEAQYGDKMSSALDITYKRPKAFEAKVEASLLGASTYIGFSTKKISWMNSLRYKTNQLLLGKGDMRGEYDPRFLDYQTYLVYKPSERWTLDVLGNISDSHYNFKPSDRETSFGTQMSVKNFKVYFDGQERDLFRTYFGTIGLTRHITKDSKIGLQLSAFNSKEQETYDIQGQYWLTETDNADELGVGTYMEHGRNYLTSSVVSGKLSLEHKWGNHLLKSAITHKWENIHENSREYEMRDSAGYSIPHTGTDLMMIYSLKANNRLKSQRTEFYVQDTYRFTNSSQTTFYTFNYGLRMSYWSFNKEFLFSPRLSLAVVPSFNQDITFRAAAGLYYQAPFYKELRDTVTANGLTHASMNEKIKSQRSIHFLLGMDYRFKMLERPFKFSVEAYYKALSDIIPYNVSSVKIIYYGENRSTGHIAGLDMKLFGEFTPGADSWLTLSLMNTRMNLNGQSIPLPSDQRYAINFFFTDFFPGTDKWKMSLKLAYADGLPFGPPHRGIENLQFRAPAYQRCDIGMSYNAYRAMEGTTRYTVKNVWLGLDCLNLFGINNISSYYWVTDVMNYQYAVPTYLTGRQLNGRVIIEF